MRKFVIGTTVIDENEFLAPLTNSEVQERLALSYPEIKNATLKEDTVGDTTTITFISLPGRKG